MNSRQEFSTWAVNGSDDLSRWTDSNRRQLQSILSDEALQEKWRTDARKFSRYFKTSYHSEQWRADASVDGNVIFSTESYIPR